MNEINFSLNHLVSIITVFIGMLYAFQFNSIHKSTRLNTYFFRWYILAITAIVFSFLLIDLNFKNTVLNFSIFVFVIPVILLLPPLIWLYLNQLVMEENKQKVYLHFLPSILIAVVISILIILFFNFNFTFLKPFLKGVIYLSLVFVFLIQNIYYIYRSIKLYLSHNEKIKEVYSYSEDVNISWFRVMLIGYIILLAAVFIVNGIEHKVSNVLFNLSILIYLVYIGAKALSQRTIHLKESEIAITTPEPIKDFSDSQKTIFSKIKEDLLMLMDEEKPYLDHSLTIYVLAKRLKTNSKYLSQVINQEFDKSFIHFINEYRVQESKKLLLEDSNFTIEAKSFMVGFKSKSSFNIAFKKNTGMTPSDYIKSHKESI